MSVEEEALEIFAHKKKVKAMEQELRTFVNMTHGPNAWNEVLRIQAEIRKKRKEAILAAKKKQEEMIMWTNGRCRFIMFPMGGILCDLESYGKLNGW